MSADWVARGIAGVSAVVALISLGWAVMSWRGSGPVLRIHALVYREVLVVRVFNAGRTADQLEHAVLGGRRGGHSGLDLTGRLGLPFRLEPGEARRWLLFPDDAELGGRWSAVSSGWASLWVLSGSMKQHRVEALPLRETRPPTVGWRLVPRRAKFARYLPLAAVPVIAAAMTSAGSAAGVLVAVLGVFVGFRALWAIDTDRNFRRRRVERWALAGGWLLSVIQLGRTSSRPVGDDVATVDVWVLAGYLSMALVIAVPGLAPQVADAWAEIRRRIHSTAERLRSRFSGGIGES